MANFESATRESTKQLKSPEKESRAEVFERFFPRGKIENIDLEKVHPVALEKLEKMSAMGLLPKDYHPGDFESVFVIKHEDGTKSYATTQTRFPEDNDGKTIKERLIRTVDILDDTLVGYCEISLLDVKTPYLKNHPFIRMTRTIEGFQRRGLAERRYAFMNALTQMEYGLPLYSSGIQDPLATAAWDKLVREGHARKIPKEKRYVYIK